MKRTFSPLQPTRPSSRPHDCPTLLYDAFLRLSPSLTPRPRFDRPLGPRRSLQHQGPQARLRSLHYGHFHRQRLVVVRYGCVRHPIGLQGQLRRPAQALQRRLVHRGQLHDLLLGRRLGHIQCVPSLRLHRTRAVLISPRNSAIVDCSNCVLKNTVPTLSKKDYRQIQADLVELMETCSIANASSSHSVNLVDWYALNATSTSSTADGSASTSATAEGQTAATSGAGVTRELSSVAVVGVTVALGLVLW